MQTLNILLLEDDKNDAAKVQKTLEADYTVFPFYDVKSAKEGVDNALLAAQGQAPATDMDVPMDAPADMPDMDLEAPADDMDPEMDDFAGSDAADDMPPEGRDMKEQAYLGALKMVKEAQVDGKVSKDILKQAFTALKAAK